MGRTLLRSNAKCLREESPKLLMNLEARVGDQTGAKSFADLSRRSLRLGSTHCVFATVATFSRYNSGLDVAQDGISLEGEGKYGGMG